MIKYVEFDHENFDPLYNALTLDLCGPISNILQNNQSFMRDFKYGLVEELNTRVIQNLMDQLEMGSYD